MITLYINFYPVLESEYTLNISGRGEVEMITSCRGSDSV